MRSIKYLALVAAAAICMSACSTGSQPAETPVSTPALTGELTVFAAASLTNVFTDIAKDFENAHPGVTVQLQFDGSSALATQILEGAKADVFASADQKNMDKVIDGGKATTSSIFTTNTLTLAVPQDNPAQIASITDLLNPGVTTVMCAPEVPCGALALAVTQAAGVSVTASSLEQNVSAVATKVSLGEADAGFVYTTDIASSQGKLVDIGLPDQARAVATTAYPIAMVEGAQVELAEAFITYMKSDAQVKLTQAGFGAP